MQLKERGCRPLISIMVLAMLGNLFVLMGCDRRPQSAPPAGPPEVAVITVVEEPVVLTTELPGRTAAFRIAEIRPQVSGLIQERLFTEGTDVKAGAILYRIDPAPFKAALDNAEAALGKAEANLPSIRLRAQRYKGLLAEKAVSQQEFDDADAALKQADAEVRFARAAVETARINLNYTKVTAPISGRSGRSNVTDGALVGAYQAMAMTTIQQLDPIYVDVTQSTLELLRLRRHLDEGRLNPNGREQRHVKLILEDGSLYPEEGLLQFRDVTVDPTTGSVVLRVVVPNPDGLLLPGMFVRAQLQEGVSERAILVPQQAVSRDSKGNPQVLIVDGEGKVALRALTIDRAIGAKWLVLDGIRAGDRVIVEGMQKVRPGTPVKAVPFTVGAGEGKNPSGEAAGPAAAGKEGGA